MPRRTPSHAQPPLGVTVRGHIEELSGRLAPFRARVHWYDPETGERRRLSTTHTDQETAAAWVARMQLAAAGGTDLAAANMTLREYGELNMALALRGLEPKTTDPYLAGWRKRVVPSRGHVPVKIITYGAVGRAVTGWIADECSKSTVKNSLAVLVRVMEQALRDGLIDRNPARVTGWQHEYKLTEDELDDPRSLALPDWGSLTALADALVARSSGQYRGWGDVVLFAACTAARIGEVSGCRVRDINTDEWTLTIRRQTTPHPAA